MLGWNRRSKHEVNVTPSHTYFWCQNRIHAFFWDFYLCCETYAIAQKKSREIMKIAKARLASGWNVVGLRDHHCSVFVWIHHFGWFRIVDIYGYFSSFLIFLLLVLLAACAFFFFSFYQPLDSVNVRACVPCKIIIFTNVVKQTAHKLYLL